MRGRIARLALPYYPKLTFQIAIFIFSDGHELKTAGWGLISQNKFPNTLQEKFL